MSDYKTLQPFRYWCQKVLPLVYDDSLSYYELLCKVVNYLNNTIEDVNTLSGDVNSLHTAYIELQNYVNSYFANLDVQQEINNKLDEMASDGTLTSVIKSINDFRYSTIVEPKLSDNLVTTFTGTNWSGDLSSGLVYNGNGDSGDVLTLPIVSGELNTLYLVSFKTTRIDLVDSFAINMGGYDFATYNGTDIFNFGLLNLNNKVTLKPTSAFNGNKIYNISVQKIIDNRIPTFVIYDKENGNKILHEVYYGTNYYVGSGGLLSLRNSGNVIIGDKSGDNITTGYWNVGVGENVMHENTVGNRNVAIGENALGTSRVGDRNVCIGSFSGYQLKQPTSNVLIGSDVMYTKENGSENVGIGRSAMSEAEGNKNVCIGAYAGGQVNSDNNVIIGNSAGTSIKNNGNNVLIGVTCGRYLDSANNVGIGANVLFPLNGTDNQINIGNHILANRNDKFTQIGYSKEYVRRSQLFGNNAALAIVNPDNIASLETYGKDGRYIGAVDIKAMDTVGTVFAAVSGKIGDTYLTQVYGNNGTAPINILDFWGANLVLKITDKPTSDIQVGTLNFDGDNLEIYTTTGWKKITP